MQGREREEGTDGGTREGACSNAAGEWGLKTERRTLGAAPQLPRSVAGTLTDAQPQPSVRLFLLVLILRSQLLGVCRWSSGGLSGETHQLLFVTVSVRSAKRLTVH